MKCQHELMAVTTCIERMPVGVLMRKHDEQRRH